MSARGMLSVVGTAVGGLIGWSDAAPAADPAALRRLFAELGSPLGPGEAELTAAVREFQAYVGLDADGVAGPRTVHLLARYAREVQELERFEQAA
ncbi:peptidoglycan-binding protein [Actinoplanes sp. TFC3]|uniref:peptidoglycan-binding protein n=1 Tax=Actinoplanes sp. TFC3 TaxID=1710355 RepID=UPI0008301C71|nr:peptidoglycan-binding protein [Actinoplanes sp. TFC3]